MFDATNRCSVEETVSIDDHLSPDGRVIEVLSEHCCQGWLEGYLLTGRHGLNWHWTSDFSEPSGPPSLAKGQPRRASFTDS